MRINVGYGYAGYNMITSLQRLGHDVPFQDPTAKVQIHMSQPAWYEFFKGQYKIGFTPWESSELPEGWREDFNTLDELWTPSPLVARWFEEAGVTVPIFVYEHGIPPEWVPVQRNLTGPIKFLHVGEPAPRKGGQMAYEAFLDVFGKSNEATFTIKAHTNSGIREFDKEGSIIGIPDDRPGVNVIREILSGSDLINLFNNHDCLVYPGYGEGYGLIPLQGIASGLPTICTTAWAPYERLILPELALSSKVIDSPWEVIHPGTMFEPSYTDLVAAYKHVANNRESISGKAYKNAFDAQREYNWDSLTEKAFAHIIKMFSP